MAKSSSASKPSAPRALLSVPRLLLAVPALLLAVSLLLLVVPLLLLAVPAVAAPPAFTEGGPVEIAHVIDGETVALADGRTLRLVDIDVPSRGALAAQAKAALSALTAKGALSLKFAGAPQDRQGRVLAALYAGNRWVQGALVRQGLARVAGRADERIGLPEMLALERPARHAQRGLWADDQAIVPAADAAKQAGRFAVVTGTVAGVVSNSGGVLLSFGADAHTGFVLTLAPDVVKLCRASGLDPAALQDKTLLVRGFVDGTRRPTIVVTYPEQIEVLRQKKAAPKSLSGPLEVK
jgi:micrococcal nuclease